MIYSYIRSEQLNTHKMAEIISFYSKMFNKYILNCACNVSTSETLTNGNHLRYKGTLPDNNKDFTFIHWKIAAAVIGIIIGIVLLWKISKNPAPGLISLAIGGFIFYDLIQDWQVGKKYNDSLIADGRLA